MADDTTKLIISVETLLKGLDKTLRGLAQVEAQLKRVSNIKVGGTASTKAFDRAAASAQRLEAQQRRLSIQTQELDNRQNRATLATQRLAQSQQRLDAAQQRLNKTTQQATSIFGLSNRQLIGFGNAARSVGQGLASLGATLSVTVTAPLVALGVTSTTAAIQMDSLRKGLTAIVGSSAEAGRQLARLTQIAKLPGIGFEEAIQGSIRLQAVGFSALDAEKALKQFSNAVALTGGGRDELARITVQLGQLAAKGKVLSQDLRPIIEAAPAVGRALKQAFGTVNADDIAEMTTSSREFLDVLVGELERLPRAAAGAKNSFENFRDTVFRAAAAVGEVLLPVLVQLAETAGPIISGLAEIFKTLPGPIQAIIVGGTAVAAILGPLTFVIGTLVLAVGRLVVGIVQFNAQLPTSTAGLFGLATGARAASGAMVALRAALIGVGIGLVGTIAQIGLAIAAYSLFNRAQKESAGVTQEQLTATEEQIKQLKAHVGFLDGLKDGVKRTADEQERLKEIYAALNIEAQSRVVGIKDETERSAALRNELERILQIRLREREQQIAGIAANAANAAARKEALDKEAAGIADQIARNTQLLASLENVGDASKQVVRNAGEQITAQQGVGQSAEDLRLKNIALTAAYNRIQAQLNGSEGEEGIVTALQKYAAQLRAVGAITPDQIRIHLQLAQAIGKFSGDIEKAIPLLQQFINEQNRAADAAKRLDGELGAVGEQLKKSSDVAETLRRNRQEVIRRNALVARESTLNFQNALKLMNEFIVKDAQLRQAIQRQAEVEGKSIGEVITEALGGTTKDRGAALRNAQEQLNDSLDKLAQERTENTIAQERAKTKLLLSINQARFDAELRSFEAFLTKRNRLEQDELDQEIRRQVSIAKLAEGEADRQRQRAGRVSGPEKLKVEADMNRALAEQLQAESKIIELRSRQRELAADAASELAQFNKERERDFRELSRELDEIAGKQLQAAEAAIDERFVEQLRALRTELAEVNRDFEAVRAAGNTAAALQGQALAKQIQFQIVSIENAKRQFKAVAEVADAQEEIRRAQAAQSVLEQQLAFDVAFRGKTEEVAIQQRLDGEAKVRDVIDAQRIRLEVLLATLRAAGLEIPQVLLEAFRELEVASKGLGELPFVEQFRLAQKEFDRLSDLRVRKIQEVEQAVARRDISELQGRIAVRVANGQYVGDLEKQAAILEEIARRSQDQGLIRQAEDARQVAIKTRNATTEVASLERELRSVTIDSLRDAFSEFGQSLVDIARGAKDVKDALLDMLDAVAGRLSQVVFDRLSDELFGSLFGTGQPAAAGGGIASAGALGAGVGQGAALQTGATAAAATFTTGVATASVSWITAVSTSIAAFAATVTAAGAGFAAAIGAASGAQAFGSVGAGIAAATGMYPAIPGGAYKFVEGGYPEAVLTTDPKHAVRQVAILREYLRQTKGLFGRLPSFAAGAMVSARDVEADLLAGLSNTRLNLNMPSGLQLEPTGTSVNLRNINLIDRSAMVRGYLRSAEGAQDLFNFISENGPEVGRRLGVK